MSPQGPSSWAAVLQPAFQTSNPVPLDRKTASHLLRRVGSGETSHSSRSAVRLTDLETGGFVRYIRIYRRVSECAHWGYSWAETLGVPKKKEKLSVLTTHRTFLRMTSPAFLGFARDSCQSVSGGYIRASFGGDQRVICSSGVYVQALLRAWEVQKGTFLARCKNRILSLASAFTMLILAA